MDRGEDTGPGGLAAAQMGRKLSVGPAGVVQIPVLGLLGEGVGVEPIQQLHIHAQAPEGELGRVNMEVGHTRNNQAVTKVLQGQIPVLLREDVEYSGTAALLAYQITVLPNPQAMPVPAVDDMALPDEIHGSSLLSEAQQGGSLLSALRPCPIYGTLAVVI